VITVNANTSAYVEFKIDFVVAGTSTPMVMAEVPATCIDVDGKTVSGKKVCEFDMISMAAASYINYDQAGGELSVVTSPGWVTGTNTAGIDYAGVDTVARQVMFTAVSASISTMTIRVGANNQTSSSQQRLRSVYFKKFTYPNAFLAMPVLQYFRGAQQGQKINLSCGLSSCANLARIIIERGSSYNDLKEIGEIWVDNQQASGSFTYNDQPGNEGPGYYRLKLIGLNQEVQYSQVIVFRSTGTTSTNAFQVYPTVMHSTGSMSFDAAKNIQALVQIVDINGRLIQQQDWQLQQGRNTLMLTGADKWCQGQYIAVLKVNGNIYQQKIIRQ
ncbi:MAG TPA: T9SS type A sorting domain-containing protein, partial [Chitinophagaceae bacterium]|nr:T9SS type A sorting domain-containing protein [Chitinophagaceae bacterium]